VENLDQRVGIECLVLVGRYKKMNGERLYLLVCVRGVTRWVDWRVKAELLTEEYRKREEEMRLLTR